MLESALHVHTSYMHGQACCPLRHDWMYGVPFIIKVSEMRNSMLISVATSAPAAPPDTADRYTPFDRRLAAARRVLCYALLLALSGCSSELLNPKGAIGEQEKNLILIATGLMLLVIIPVIGLTLYFAWRYRASNLNATYAPKWSHSNKIEVIIWVIPCVIVAFLAVLIWNTTHSLDPYQPLKSKEAPIRVQVVALNWKWLFIYPDYGIATVNQLPIPVDTPIEFKLTAESLMNSFFIPQLGSQVYAMAGMQTQLHLIANSPGVYDGLSAAFSGEGFSDMHFNAVATSRQEFDRWMKQARNSPLKLNKATYSLLEQASHGNPVAVYTDVDPGLFDGVVNKYMHGHAASSIGTTASKGSPKVVMSMPHHTSKPAE
jgi:cytochrome o ubiquinol oxidase subunit 2